MSVVVYEATGNWAAALRREVLPRVGIVEVRTADELLRELSQNPAALAAVEVTEPRIESAIATVAQVTRRFPRATVVALADRGLSRFESIVREAGAAHIVLSTRQAREIAAIALKHLASRDQNDFNTEAGNYEQQILARLPWGS